VAGIKKTVTEKVTVTVTEKVKIDPPVHLECDDRIRKWAWENGYTLIFLSVCFLITWVVILVSSNV
jgi:hypothetical protein